MPTPKILNNFYSKLKHNVLSELQKRGTTLASKAAKFPSNVYGIIELRQIAQPRERAEMFRMFRWNSES